MADEPMTDRNFFLERLMERVQELRCRCTDQETYRVELAQLLVSVARNEDERREWEQMLKTWKFFQGLSQEDERYEVIEQVRAKLRARHPWARFGVLRLGPRSTRHWGIQWSNGPSEAEIKELVAPFARKDLTFRYLRKSEEAAR